jgi:ActR/RegA family two-component response regulator
VRSSNNVLIVEDDEEWCGIYRRAVEREISNPAVRVARDLVSASRLIDLMKFAVAFVDVGLDTEDDHNVDGLLVMEKIRSMSDETSLVVVTGRSAQDVLPITRDAIMKYGAYDTVAKNRVDPRTIRDLAAGGLAAYRKASAAGPRAAREALRGATHPMFWDDDVMRATKFRGSAGNLYAFLNELLREFLPIAATPEGAAAEIDSSANVVHGSYWSRAAGAEVIVCFGALNDLDRLVAEANGGRKLLGQYSGGQLVKELTGYGMKGTVFLLAR